LSLILVLARRRLLTLALAFHFLSINIAHVTAAGIRVVLVESILACSRLPHRAPRLLQQRRLLFLGPLRRFGNRGDASGQVRPVLVPHVRDRRRHLVVTHNGLAVLAHLYDAILKHRLVPLSARKQRAVINAFEYLLLLSLNCSYLGLQHHLIATHDAHWLLEPSNFPIWYLAPKSLCWMVVFINQFVLLRYDFLCNCHMVILCVPISVVLAAALHLLDHLRVEVAYVAVGVERPLLAPAALANPIILVVVARSQEVLGPKALFFNVDRFLWYLRLEIIFVEIFGQVLYLILLRETCNGWQVVQFHWNDFASVFIEVIAKLVHSCSSRLSTSTK
jgi:hypothetical protein